MLTLASAGFKKQRCPHVDLPPAPTAGIGWLLAKPQELQFLLHLAPLATELQHEGAPGYPQAS